jgi:2,4-dienoyl-CoA reductase-like NADH-dependent reductase (Old Yellow Enzyme family)
MSSSSQPAGSAGLFDPLTIRGLTFSNRIVVSPMCQYSCKNGFATDWHLVHLGSRAIGGAALVMVEATAVSPEGRISPADSGIWSDAHAEAFRRITKFEKEAGTIPGIQIAHAGRKASTDVPWRGGKPVGSAAGGWIPIAPSPLPFDDGYPVPREMTMADIDRVVAEFAAAASRAMQAGFEVVEVHSAHGYLLHEFLSPLSNRRTDDYGGSLENRMRLTLRVAQAVREIWPTDWPVFVRISATDWAEGGWDLPQSIELAKALKRIEIDLIDCSSGALVPRAKIPLEPGYQVPFAAAIRREAGIATGAVGMIAQPQQADDIISRGDADVVLLARAMLHDPYWPLHAAEALGEEITWPKQYGRIKTSSVVGAAATRK